MAISVGDAVLKLGVDTKDMEKGLKGIGSKIKQHQKAIGLGMVAMGGAITAGLAMSLKAAVNFETAMREVNTMMGLSQEEFTDFSKEVQNLAAELGVNAVDSAKALYQAISAGVPKENVIGFLEIATKAAIGGVTETEVAVDGLTTVINAFKLPMSDAQRVADLMFTTVKGGKTTFEELSAALFQVAPIAAASGVSFDEVSAALATMTKQGVPTKIATTQLRQAMVALQKPTEDMKKAITSLGYESGQAMLEELGLAETLNVLRDSTAGSNEQLMTMFGSVEAGQAVLSLTGDNAAMFAADLDAMANSAGASDDAFKEMENSISRQMVALKASFNDISITVGNVLIPMLTSLLDKIKPIIQSIKDWTGAHPGLTKAIVIGTAAFGALLVVFGSLLLIMPSLIAAGPLIGLAMHAALGPIGLITLAITALIAVGVLLWKNWDKVVHFFKMAWINIKIFFLNGVKNILESLSTFTSFIPGLNKLVDKAKQKIEEMINAEEVEKQALRVSRAIEEMDTKIVHLILTQDEFTTSTEATAEQLKVLTDAAEKATGATDELNSATEASKVSIGSAKWEADGYTYRMSLFTQAEIDAAKAAGYKVEEISKQTEAMERDAEATRDSTMALEEYTEQARETGQSLEGLGVTEAGEWGGQIVNVPVGGHPAGLTRSQLWDKGITDVMIAEAIAAKMAGGPRIPGFQHGGIAMRPMVASIAEKGPEAIIPLNKMGLVNITGNNFYVREEADIEKIGRKLVEKIRLKTGAHI